MGQRRFIDSGPDIEIGKKIRKLIVDKNELYFHQSRPQNQAYLWGFRKHEQGNNFKIDVRSVDQGKGTGNQRAE